MKDIIISVIIPVYNEEETIQKVVTEHLEILDGFQVKDYEILCLDDASTDRTPQILKQLETTHAKVRVVTHRANRGIYESFSDLAHEAKGTHIYQTGADGQWSAINLLKLFQASLAGSFDLVIGVRENRNQIYTPWRQFLSSVFNWLPKVFFGVETKDANSIKFGIREIFNFKLLSHSFFGEIERVIEAKRRGYQVGFQAIDFLPRGGGKASGAKLKNIIETLRDFFKFLFSARAHKT